MSHIPKSSRTGPSVAERVPSANEAGGRTEIPYISVPDSRPFQYPKLSVCSDASQSPMRDGKTGFNNAHTTNTTAHPYPTSVARNAATPATLDAAHRIVARNSSQGDLLRVARLSIACVLYSEASSPGSPTARKIPARTSSVTFGSASTRSKMWLRSSRTISSLSGVGTLCNALQRRLQY